MQVLVNTLLRDAPRHIKLSDFGSARVTGDVKSKQYTMGIGTPSCSQFLVISCLLYPVTAPEVLMSASYSQKADVYSFGILSWCIFTQQTPYTDEENSFGSLHLLFYLTCLAIIKYVCDGNRPPIPEAEEPTNNLYKLLQQCWAQKPEDRPDFLTIVDNLSQFFTSYGHIL